MAAIYRTAHTLNEGTRKPNMMKRVRTSALGRALDKPLHPANEQREPLCPRLEDNIERIMEAFGGSPDVAIGRSWLDPAETLGSGFVYLESLAEHSVVQEVLKQMLLLRDSEAWSEAADFSEKAMHRIGKHIPSIGNAAVVSDFESLYASVLSGDTVLLVDGCPYGVAVQTAAENERAIEEPMTQSVVRGPREGFTESIQTNLALIRKRIRSTKLWLETMTIGEITGTNVGLMYVNGVVNESVVAEVRARLGRIRIDGIFESGNIEELIQDETFTPFPTLYNSERPDVIAAGLLEGRVAILVDGTPFVLMAPALFTQFYQSAEDYYQRAEFATLIRLLRYVCFFISLLAPSLYIAVTTFHQELLPSPLLFSLAAQREGNPFPAFIEALLMEITFEILREAGVRLPKTVGQAVSIVGALVIGQAAVEAGLVSPAMVIVVAITAIANFVIPSFNMGISIRIIRFALMVFAATFGLFGVTVGLIALVQHLCSLRSFGVPYMSPMAPFNLSDQKDTILRLPLWELVSRPRSLSRRNPIREQSAAPVKSPPRGRQ